MRPSHAILVILGLTLWRVGLLALDRTDLFVDEAQYWLWGQHLAFGYYSKPPMIAWIIRAMTELFGSDSTFAVRLAGPLLHMGTALVLMLPARHLYGEKVAAWTGIAWITLPGVALASFLFSTDTPLLFFYAGALAAFLALTKRSSVPLALLLGLCIGLGLLSKYAMAYFVVTAILAAILLPQARISWRDVAIAGAVALACIAPNLVWNGENGGVTFRHTAENAGWDGLRLHPLKAAEFFLAQFGVIGPVLFAALLRVAYRTVRGRTGVTERHLLLMSLPILLLVTFQALLSRAYANWGVTAYVAGTIVATAFLVLHARRALLVSVAINGAVALLLPLAIVFAPTLTLPGGRQPFERYLGRADLSRTIEATAKAQALTTIVADNRDILADLFYTLRDAPLAIRARPTGGPPAHFYEQRFPLAAETSGEVLFVTAGTLDCPGTTSVTEWTPDTGYLKGRTIYAYRTPASCLLPG